MVLDKFADEMAKKHIERSLAEMRDTEKTESWKNGDRAREQAKEIAEALVKEAFAEIDKGEQTNG